jgi:glycosyltransferase involved in cell wall biosynthesis
MSATMYNKTVGSYMPTHNSVELLEKAINSVLQQNYQNFELVVNDGSSDGTQADLESLTDPRISFIEHNTSTVFDLNECSNQILVNRERFLAVDSFDEKISVLQYHNLWIRLIAKFGSAYHIGKASYIVTDDHSLECISLVTNKLHTITMFEQKHNAIMSKRNKENFIFYKAKLRRGDFSFSNLIKSSRYGLVGLKARYYRPQYLKKHRNYDFITCKQVILH